jgi:hypothetical protein
MDHNLMQQYVQSDAVGRTAKNDHHEVMEMFANIVAGRATAGERERYLAAWRRATPLCDTVAAAY